MNYGQRIGSQLKTAYGEMLQQAQRERAMLNESRRMIMARGSETFSAEVSKSAAGAGEIVPQYRCQRIIRPLYGKAGFVPPAIGDHPDFSHLAVTRATEFHPITTMFMDIESSTRLNLLFDPETVYQIKNTFIMAAIEIINAFDGHVHRIMGDAVMAYFGRKGAQPEQAIIDGLNCASMLMFFVKTAVIPDLNQKVADTQFGIRVGLDYGDHENVLWSCYGYPGICEVTATSFNVDVAAKLQQSAGRNQIMLGESLRGKLDLHAELLDVKKYVRDGVTHTEPIVLPNHTCADGTTVDYRQHIFKEESYLTLSPLASEVQDVFQFPGARLSPVIITATRHLTLGGPPVGAVISSGTPVPKQQHLCFRITPPPDLRYPCTVKYIVENHGRDASEHPNYGNHDFEHQVLSSSDLARYPHWEETAYRGLHYLIVEISSGDIITHRGKFGVYVE